MKTAADFRAIARDALKGVWTIAVIVGILAALLGGASNGPEINFDFNNGNLSASMGMAGQDIVVFGSQPDRPGLIGRLFLTGLALYIAIAAVVVGVLYFVLGSVIQIGYACFNLDLVDRRELGYNTLFAYFPYWKNLAKTNLLMVLRIFLWMLLLVIPGIVAGYSYALTPYIQAEQPELSPTEALERSKALMNGNRMRLFCLHLSFIGWDILATLSLGLGHLFLQPYKQAANAAFYREICAEQTGFSA